ncbi:hypothetical protein DL98DRAFT_651591 [Cadophora sp. DSE1049]|nr:hypothetical protein DL98DRAFT_651591 [Cadophora sp. DSE1049]
MEAITTPVQDSAAAAPAGFPRLEVPSRIQGVWNGITINAITLEELAAQISTKDPSFNITELMAGHKYEYTVEARSEQAISSVFQSLVSPGRVSFLRVLSIPQKQLAYLHVSVLSFYTRSYWLQFFPTAVPVHSIETMVNLINVLADMNFHIEPFACSQWVWQVGDTDTVLWVCNDNNHAIDPSLWWVSTYATDIAVKCRGPNGVGGQEFDTDGWNIIVRRLLEEIPILSLGNLIELLDYADMAGPGVPLERTHTHTVDRDH